MDPHVRQPGTPPSEARSLGELFRTLTADASTLIRQEMALARTEMRQNVRAAVRDAGGAAVGAGVALVGLLVLVVALIAFLGDLLGGRYALSALIVAAVLISVGAFLVLRGVKRFQKERMAPEKALAELRQTGDWARTEAADFRTAIATGHVPAHGDGHGGPACLRLVRGGASAGESSSGGGAPGGSKGAQKDRAQGRGERERRGEEGSGGKNQRPGDEGELPVSAPLWKRVMHDFTRNDLSNEAAKIAYYFFLSLPPALMAIFGLTGIFGGQKTAEWLSSHLSSALPGEASGLVGGFVHDVVYKHAPGPLTIGLLLALWSAAGVMMALEDSLNAAYEITCDRGFIKRRLVALATMVGCALLFVAGSAALLAGPKVADALGLGAFGETVWSVVQWPLSFLLIVGAFWIIYYVLPNRDQSTYKGTLFKSASVAAAGWLVATFAFRLYITHFSSYSKTYGILGTLIVLLLWLWLTSLVILLGGELSSEMERTETA
ncbi:MAG: putative rane protein [Gemmatimonadetes bacterium]|nr:putative rane protein [Gemmatimonadota bacterium]